MAVRKGCEQMKKYCSVLIYGMMAVLVCVLVFAVFRIAALLHQKEQNKQLSQQLVELAVTPRPKKDLPAQQEQEKTTYSVPIEVDFAALKQQAPDVRAWIYCPDTPIHHPVVQGKDNYYYLRRGATGQPNYAGSIFLDRRNPSDLTGTYNLIHGHNLKDDTMFGTLPNYSDQAYYDAHKILYLLTPQGDYVIELFAGFTTDSSDNIYTIPLTGTQRMELTQYCIERSDFVSQVQPKEDDRLMILSTCAYDYDDARYAVIGVLRNTDPYTEENR